MSWFLDIAYEWCRRLVFIAAASLSAYLVVNAFGRWEWGWYKPGLLIHVFGFDGGLWLDWELSGHNPQIQSFGGWKGDAFTVMALGFVALPTLFISYHGAMIATTSSCRSRIFRFSLAMSTTTIMMLIIIGISAVVFSWLGAWNLFVDLNSPIVHRGYSIPRPFYSRIIGFITLVWFICLSSYPLISNWLMAARRFIYCLVASTLLGGTLLFIGLYFRDISHWWTDQFIGSHSATIIGLIVLTMSLWIWDWTLFGLKSRFTARWAKSIGVCQACNYDLRGSIAGGGVTCPECGHAIPENAFGNAQPVRTPEIREST